MSLHVEGVRDFKGDGRTDILWKNDDGTVTDWLGQANGGFVGNLANSDSNVGSAWQVAGTGDFNGDGRTDILWRNTSNGNVAEWLGEADGGFLGNSAAANNAALSWHVVGVGDVNGDGKADILWRNDDGTITDWLAQATGAFSGNAAASQPVTTAWQVAAVGDFNGDGRADLLWQKADGTLETWQGASDGEILSPTEQAWQAAVAGVTQFVNEIGYQLDTGTPPGKDTSGAGMEYIPNEIASAAGAIWDGGSYDSEVGIFQQMATGYDPTFGVTFEDNTDFGVTFGGNFDSLSLVDSLTNTFQFDINGMDLTATWEAGPPPSDSNDIVVTAPEAIVVTGHRNPSSSGLFQQAGYFTLSPIGLGLDFGDGYGGAGGANNPGAIIANAPHTTLGGHVYTIGISLTAQQAKVADLIMDYGESNGYSSAQIDVAMADAFYESTFNQSAQNAGHYGVFQYDQTTWNTFESGNLFQTYDQVVAIYNDITRDYPRYESAISSNAYGIATDGLTFGQYFEIKHEPGDNVTDWLRVNPTTGNEYIEDWSSKDSTLNLHIQR